jgi:hypothetical protein
MFTEGLLCARHCRYNEKFIYFFFLVYQQEQSSWEKMSKGATVQLVPT